MKREPLRPFSLPELQRHRLSNGLTVHVLKRGELPIVSARLVVRAGDIGDVPGKLGLADFASRLLRRGAAGKSADDISEQFEFLGAMFNAFAEQERMNIEVQTATKHLNAVLDLMAAVTLQPDFPEKEVESAKRRAIAALVNELDDPGALADRALSRSFWGAHPYGHEMASGRADLEAMSRADLVRFHQERMGPAISHLFLVGNIDAVTVLPLIERAFAHWQGGPSAEPTAPEWQGIARPGEVVIVDKADQSQVQMRIGAKGTKRGHPDLYPVTVLNGILGGGFTSRLVNEVRVKRGLSYGVSSTFDNLGVAGLFEVSSFTKTESVNALLDVSLQEIQKLRQKGATPKEVETVKRYTIGLFPSRLETNDALASLLADIVNYRLPDDWVEKYRGNIDAVSSRQVNAAAERYLPANSLEARTIVLVGNASQLVPKVEKYGRVSVVTQKELE